MKIPAQLLRLGVIGSLAAVILSAAVLETNVEPVQASTAQVSPQLTPEGSPVTVVVPGVEELREQLRAMRLSHEQLERSNAEASERWTMLAQQNSALSNVLGGLQQTLAQHRDQQVELARQSNSLAIKVISGAAVAVFLVFLFSYWFQLRCLNRVMELSHSVPALPPGHGPVLLEQENPATSKLLNAMKLLEQRLEQLEVTGDSHVRAEKNGDHPEIASAHVGLLNGGPAEGVRPMDVSLLLAKGQVLLDTDRLAEALHCFQEAVTADPGNAEAHLKKGVTLERMNRLDAALSSYEEALRLNPKRTVASVYKARVLAALHRYDEAISVYDSALGKKTPKETPIFVS